MKRAVKPQRRKQGRLAVTGVVPVARTVDAPTEPEELAAEAALPFLPDESQRPPQTDIERADERKVGSVEAAPHPEPENGITGFVESTSGDPAAAEMPPHLAEE